MNKDNQESFIKIGKTFRDLKIRFKSSLPYNYEVIDLLVYPNAKEAYYKELELLKKFKHLKYQPLIEFDGQSECFSMEILNELL